MIATAARPSKSLYLQVLAAAVLGVLAGYFFPELGAALKPLGEAFVRLVRMLIAPIIFITVVLGIGRIASAAEIGRIAVKALVYFEVLTTVALVIGLVVGHVVRPGDGFGARARRCSTASASSCGWRRSPCSGRWRSASPPSASARCSSCCC